MKLNCAAPTSKSIEAHRGEISQAENVNVERSTLHTDHSVEQLSKMTQRSSDGQGQSGQLVASSDLNGRSAAVPECPNSNPGSVSQNSPALPHQADFLHMAGILAELWFRLSKYRLLSAEKDPGQKKATEVLDILCDFRSKNAADVGDGSVYLCFFHFREVMCRLYTKISPYFGLVMSSATETIYRNAPPEIDDISLKSCATLLAGRIENSDESIAAYIKKYIGVMENLEAPTDKCRQFALARWKHLVESNSELEARTSTALETIASLTAAKPAGGEQLRN